MFLLNFILALLRAIWALLLACVQIVVTFVLAVITGALYILRAALPFLLRGGCVILFVFGFLQGVMETNALYTRLTDNIGALFVAAAFGLVLLVMPVRSLLLHLNVWSALFLAGALGFLGAFVSMQAQSNFLLQWIARGLPVSLAASGLIYIAVQQKQRRAVFTSRAE